MSITIKRTNARQQKETWWNVQISDNVPGSTPLAYFRVRAKTKKQAMAIAKGAVRFIVWEA